MLLRYRRSQLEETAKKAIRDAAKTGDFEATFEGWLIQIHNIEGRIVAKLLSLGRRTDDYSGFEVLIVL